MRRAPPSMQDEDENRGESPKERERKNGGMGSFPSRVHADMPRWSATSAKLANLLSSPFAGGKNIGAILRMATKGVPLEKMTKI
jgi:hypothetical protein